jgi:hypothetical protein
VTCSQCRQDEKIFGGKTDCRDCRMPVLDPANYQVWELYKTLNNPFCREGSVDPFELLRRFGVNHPFRTLQKLEMIYAIAAENAKRGRE